MKVELTLTIDGVDQDIPIPDDEELTLRQVGDIAAAVTTSLITALNDGEAPIVEPA